MAVFPWKDEFSVGVKEIDDQHRRLIDLINGFYDALSQGQARSGLGELLRGMLEYTRYHFSTEEELMRGQDYPALEAHSREHGLFVIRVSDMAERFERGELVLSLEATGFLRDWLSGHILGTDKTLGRYLVSRGAV
jgi:hemerythrin